MKLKYLKVIFLVGLSVVVLTACSSNSSNSSGEVEALGPISFNWGEVDIFSGDIEQSFKFKNIGDEDLYIHRASTSCMCTTAKVLLENGQVSPEFGMTLSPLWNGVVRPGEEFEVLGVFDPLEHGPDAVGPTTRSIYLETSDSKSNIEIKMMGNITKDEVQGFTFEEEEFDFGMLKQSGGEVRHDFNFTYRGEAPISVVATPTSCQCATAEISNQYFENGDSGVLTVYFDPNLHEEPEGRFFKTVSVITEPELEEDIEIKMWAEIDLDLGPEYYKLKGEHID